MIWLNVDVKDLILMKLTVWKVPLRFSLSPFLIAENISACAEKKKADFFFIHHEKLCLRAFWFRMIVAPTVNLGSAISSVQAHTAAVIKLDPEKQAVLYVMHMSGGAFLCMCYLFWRPFIPDLCHILCLLIVSWCLKKIYIYITMQSKS